ncbi:MAG: YdcF family protein [Terriglobia bacterium]
MTLSPQRRQPEHGSVLLWLLVLLLLSIVLLVVYVLRGPLLRALGDWWVVDEPLEKAQAIVVLGGDTVMGDRVRHAVKLYQAGYAPRVVLSGASIRSYFSEAELMQREATNLGVPAEHLIVARHNTQSTLKEAQELRRVLTEHNFRKIIVVTSNYHTRRVRRIFRTLFRRQGIQVLVSAAPDANFNPANWWQQRQGRALLLLEVVKSLYTWWELRDLPPPRDAGVVCLPLGNCAIVPGLAIDGGRPV